MGESLSSFLLPSPLMAPAKWPDLDDAIRWLLPLEVATVAGGPLKKRFEDLLERDQAAWFLSARFFRDANLQSEIRRREAAGWLKTFPGVRLYADHPAKIPAGWLEESGSSVSRISSSTLQPPTLFDWAKEIFPELTDELGELRLRAELNDYLKKMPSAEDFPMEELRFFAGVLRQKGVELADLAAKEWARFQCLYSPQNEEAEARQLPAGAVIVNPTVQILRSTQKNSMTVYLRWDQSLHEVSIGWREAYLIDEVSESPRILASVLLQGAEGEAAGLSPVFSSLAEAERAPSFVAALDSLLKSRIFLQGRS
jgi:hypothetical protein